MRKLVNASFAYLIAALVGGVFYREFTKAFSFTGTTTLAFVHLHLFVLGVVFLLVLALLADRFGIDKAKGFKPFFVLFNVGLIVTVGTFVWRGVLQTMSASISAGLSGAISGVAGLGHACLGISLIIVLVIIRKAVLAKTGK